MHAMLFHFKFPNKLPFHGFYSTFTKQPYMHIITSSVDLYLHDNDTFKVNLQLTSMTSQTLLCSRPYEQLQLQPRYQTHSKLWYHKILFCKIRNEFELVLHEEGTTHVPFIAYYHNICNFKTPSAKQSIWEMLPCSSSIQACDALCSDMLWICTDLTSQVS